MFKIVIAFICAAHISYQSCNEDNARAVVVLPEGYGCYEAIPYMANVNILWDKRKEYLKVICKQ